MNCCRGSSGRRSDNYALPFDRGWYVTGFNDTAPAKSQKKTFLRCITDECVAAATPDLIKGDHKGWEVSYDGTSFESLGAPVNTSCCDSTAAKCGDRPGHEACDITACKDKYKTFWSCLAASVTGCCQAFGWIDNGVCLCKNTRPSCKPITTKRRAIPRAAWPHDSFPGPQALLRPPTSP